MYKRVSAEIVKALQRIVGESNVLVGDEEIDPYTHDEVVGLQAVPEVVVKATSAEQISEIFRLAQRERVAPHASVKSSFTVLKHTTSEGHLAM